jgi:Na+/melibiose symporter-like transporter
VAAAGSGGRFGGLLMRLMFSTVLVLATWNPTGTSFFHWLLDHEAAERPYLALAGVTLLILWVIYVQATFRSIGVLGVVLLGAFLGALLWVLNANGILALGQGNVALWAALVCLGIVLGVGMGWSHVSRRLTGQVDVDDVAD